MTAKRGRLPTAERLRRREPTKYSPPSEGCRVAAGWSLFNKPPRHFATQNATPP